VATAQERSSWHRERLAGVDPASLEESGLDGLPIMTKEDVTVSFDEIVTDPRLTLSRVEGHLAGLEAGPRYLLDHYQPVVSSGPNGVREVFVYDWRGWATCYAGAFRYLLRDRGGEGLSTTVVADGAAAHLVQALQHTFTDPETTRAPHLGELPVLNCWLTPAAGPIAAGCGRGPWMHLSDDLIILEAVDVNGMAVPAGAQSAKVLLTVLYNHALPLIRYEVADQVTLIDGACPCGSAHTLLERG
jgi:hypothetical protein